MGSLTAPSIIIMDSVTDTLGYGWRSRRVWWFTATARTKARYSRTVFGSFWLGLSNILSIGVLSAVYGTVFKVQDFNEYVVFLGTGLVVWNSLASAIAAAPFLFAYNAVHLQNTNLNPVFYTLEEWAFQVQTFFQSFCLVVIALSYFQPSLIPHLLVSAWLPMTNLLIFMYWFPLVACLLGARYRDFYQLVPILLQLVFLLSPILYRKENLGSLAWTADLNPLYRVLSPLRHSLLQGQVLWEQVIVMALVNLLGLWLGLHLLNRERPHLPFLI